MAGGETFSRRWSWVAWSVPALLSVLSCDQNSRDRAWRCPVASAPEPLDLQMPGDFFVTDGRGLPSSPHIDDCHTQGMVIAGADLVVSCVLYDPDLPEQRTRVGKSYLLRAPLCDVVGCGGPPAPSVTWSIADITGEAPAAESQRITRMLSMKEDLTPEELAIRHLMTHPSGLVYDPDRGGVWVANSVYAPDSYSALLLIRPDMIGQGAPAALVAREIPVSDHVGALSLVHGRYLVGASWGATRFVIVDLDANHQPVSIDNPLLGSEHEISLQDCDRWDATTMLCGGSYRYRASPDTPDIPLPHDDLVDPGRDTVRVARGRVQRLRIDVARFPAIDVEVTGYLTAALWPGALPGMDFGIRVVREDENGDHDLVRNDYGGYRTPLPLTSEGMALDLAGQHMYFLPADIPSGWLVRMKLRPCT
jgi:hypothetical protein